MHWKRSLIIAQVAFVGCVVGSLCVTLADPQKTAEEIKKTYKIDSTIVKKLIAELFAIKDYATMKSLPRKWRKTLSPNVQRELVAELLAYVDSKQPLALVQDKVEIRYINVYNACTEGGRATWAIQELFLITDPAREKFIKPPVPPLIVRLSQRIIRAMSMPEWAKLETLSVAEQVRLASSADADPRLLRELARSSEVAVRLAVAKNYRTSLDTIKKRLINDPNEDVRQAAITNSHAARSVLIKIEDE